MYWNVLEMTVTAVPNSWIVTLDVLKYKDTQNQAEGGDGWIVTLDVLKSACQRTCRSWNTVE